MAQRKIQWKIVEKLVKKFGLFIMLVIILL